MLLPFDLAGFLVTMWVTAVQGVENLRATGDRRAVPIEPQVELLSDAQLTPQQLARFAEFDGPLQALGYTFLCNYRVTNLFGGGAVRNYYHGVDGSNCRVVLVEYAAVTKGRKHFTQAMLIQFASEFPDGSRLVTHNSEQARLLDIPPGWIVQWYPSTANPARLQQAHARRMATLPAPLPAVTSAEQLIERYHAQHREHLDQQIRSGLFAVAPDGKTARGTDRLYRRGVWRHLNPLAHPFRANTFLPAAVAAIGLPMLASWWANAIGAMAAPLSQMPVEWSAILFVSLAVLAGGAIAGWFLTRQQIIWTFLLLYLPLVLFGRVAPVPGVVFAASILAHYSRQMRMRRRLVFLPVAG